MDPDRPIVRWSLIVLWAVIAAMLYRPVMAFFAWPVLVFALIGGVWWTAQDFKGVLHQTEPLPSGRVLVRLELLVMIGLATSAVLLATPLSMVVDGRALPLSTSFAPTLASVLLVAGLRAVHTPTPRRIAIASLVALAVMPMFAAVRILREPLFGWEYRATWMVPAFSLCTLAIGAIGVHLGIVARRHGFGDEILAPPPRAIATKSPMGSG